LQDHLEVQVFEDIIIGRNLSEIWIRCYPIELFIKAPKIFYCDVS